MSKPLLRKGLGKGLGALLNDNDIVTFNAQNVGSEDILATGGVNLLPVSYIEVNPFQPRTDFEPLALQELADSIKLQGLIQPITVRKLERDRYQLISGERRFRASQIAGLKELPAYVRSADDQQMLEMALIENIQRENLNPMEIALSFQRMIDECNLKQEELGDRVSKSRSTVANFLRLLKLPPSIQAAIRDQKITMGHAKAIISLESVDKQIFVLNEVLTKDLSVRKVEEMVREILANSSKKGSSSTTSSTASNAQGDNIYVRKIADNLTSIFGNKVEVKSKSDGGGLIQIPYLSNEDLARILEIIEK